MYTNRTNVPSLTSSTSFYATIKSVIVIFSYAALQRRRPISYLDIIPQADVTKRCICGADLEYAMGRCRSGIHNTHRKEIMSSYSSCVLM